MNSSESTLENVLLDVKAVAEMIGCSTRHVIRQADAGSMPTGLKVGALRRWRRKELLTWIEKGCPPIRPDQETIP